MDRHPSRFRPDIEGLRAIAVLMILAYHARLPFVTGGYVGVDVFFVISGFLITRLIAAELIGTGTISLTAFYARRARRLLPAALLVIVVTVVASIALLPAIRIAGIVGDASASALYVGNIRFAAQATDYLQAGLEPSPLLHYWSLGVEEQFYLVWPALLALAWRFGALRRTGGATPGVLVATVVLTGIVSFGVSVVLTGSDAPLAFYLLPARAWELAAGGLVALALDGHVRVPSALALAPGAARTGVTLAGAGLAVAAVLILNDTTPFPGVAAALPVAGAVLVLATGGSGTTTVIHRVLGSPPLRWIGRISYSLYLWHWPLLIVPAAALGNDLPVAVRIGLVGLTFPIAALSERFVERPIRSGGTLRLAPGRTVVLAVVAGLITAISATSAGAAMAPQAPIADAGASLPPLVLPTVAATIPATPSVTTGSPGIAAEATGAATPSPSVTPSGLPVTAPGPVPADLIPPLADARTDLPVIYRDGCHLKASDTKSGVCRYADTGSSTEVVLLGDSHAAQWFPTLEAIALARGWRLELLTKAACPFADVPVWSASLLRPYDECDAWRSTTLARIAAEHPALVVVSNTRLVDLVVDGKPVESLDQEKLWDAGLTRTLATLRSSAGAVLLLGDTPNANGDPPACLSKHLADALACATPAATAISPARIAAERAAAATAGVSYVDPSAWVCPSDPCPAVIGGYLVYRDGGHMATAFARALAPYLEGALPPIP